MATPRTLASSILHSHTIPRAPCRFRFHFRFPSTFCTLTFSSSKFPAKSSSRLTVFSASSADHRHSTSQDLAVLLEVDGVLMDAHRVGNRIAFNKAFERLGLDCANWTEPVYSDLSKFIDDAYNEGIPVVILTAYSKSGDNIAGLAKIVAALRAGAEYAGLPVCNCVLVAGSQSGVSGATQVGMPSVVLRSSLTSRAEFPLANATVDGFGGADLTISKLRNIRPKNKQRTEW
ncbi:hypothetical protein LR48_Vigan09g185000 [Vigna angularis]|uniref:Uncharacterized protein n=1 Tax=Phaseolus angularis TaxID=3914 RepID=A0A0L9VDQ3_PHAAN|nr:hypothetical protein LR48_Vigan09g185000 [Vigna angularis]